MVSPETLDRLKAALAKHQKEEPLTTPTFDYKRKGVTQNTVIAPPPMPQAPVIGNATDDEPPLIPPVWNYKRDEEDEQDPPFPEEEMAESLTQEELEEAAELLRNPNPLHNKGERLTNYAPDFCLGFVPRCG